MTVDLVMWTRNGGTTLARVLAQIDHIAPADLVGQQIMVDDDSTDFTRQYASAYGWQVIPNPSRGIAAAANEALRHVTAPAFVSVEQDLFLSHAWFDRVPPLLHGSVAVASGVRFTSCSRALRALQRYVMHQYRGQRHLASWLRSREASAFTLGKTLDNTIYRTDVLRRIGGFPHVATGAGVDTVLAYTLARHGYTWAVDPSVHSLHLRNGVRDELRHQRWWGQQTRSIARSVQQHTGERFPTRTRDVAVRAALSPFTGVFMALRTGEPQVAVWHPLVKLNYLAGVLCG